MHNHVHSAKARSKRHKEDKQHLLNAKCLLGLLITGVNGEEQQLVLPEAGSKRPEHPRRVVLVGEQHQLGLTHGAAKGAVNVAAADARDNIWESSNSKGVKFFGGTIACSTLSTTWSIAATATFTVESSHQLDHCQGGGLPRKLRGAFDTKVRDS